MRLRVTSIREAVDSDRDAVVSLWRLAGLTRPWNDPDLDFDRALAGPASTVLVDEADGDDGTVMVATVMVGYDGHRGWLYYLAVTPERQGAGRGRGLVRAAETWLRVHGAPKVEVMVRRDNGHVLGFYEALGYDRQDVEVLGSRL